jgi:hypothetical protein
MGNIGDGEASASETVQLYQFHGRVLPMYHKIGMRRPLENLVVTAQGMPPISLRATIQDSVVLVDCESAPPITKEIFNEAYDHARKLAHNVVDLVCFHYGLGLTVIIDSWTDPNGVKKDISIIDLALRGISTGINPEVNLEKPLQLLFSNPGISMVLHDLTQALVMRENTIINCARAIDGLKHLLSPDEKNEAKAWDHLRDTLNVTKPYILPIMDASKGPRHGKRGAITADLQSLAIRRSWQIMNRYLEYRLRESGPLGEPDFPPLAA